MTFTVRTLGDGVTKVVVCDRCPESVQSRLRFVLERFKATHDCDTDPGGAAA